MAYVTNRHWHSWLLVCWRWESDVNCHLNEMNKCYATLIFPFHLKIFIKGDYAGGRYWADVVRAIAKKLETTNKSKMMLRPKLLMVRNRWKQCLELNGASVYSRYLFSPSTPLTPLDVMQSIFWLTYGSCLLELSPKSYSSIIKMPRERVRLMLQWFLYSPGGDLNS